MKQHRHDFSNRVIHESVMGGFEHFMPLLTCSNAFVVDVEK